MEASMQRTTRYRWGKWLVLALAFGCSGVAAAADAVALAFAETVKPLLMPSGSEGTFGDWRDLEAVRGVQWAPLPPAMLDKPSPDGNYFARPGRGTIGGKPMVVVASGARTLVMSVYFNNPSPQPDADAMVAGFRAAGYIVALARCPAPGARDARRRWYRIALAGKRPAWLAVGPLASDNRGEGYTVLLDAKLPLMTPQEAGRYTEQCADAPATAPMQAPAPRNGVEGVVAVIAALMRPSGAPLQISWQALGKLPALAWNAMPPLQLRLPYDDAGVDDNPQLLEGRFETPTTTMTANATGDARGVTRVYLRDGRNLGGTAVFDVLRREGHAITPLRCGRPYTKMSHNWFRIAKAGYRPAVLYRKIARDGELYEVYGLRLDNTLPPMRPGERDVPPGGHCPG
jgi:hypothetical protein